MTSLTTPVLVSPSPITSGISTDIQSLTLVVQAAPSAVFLQATILGDSSTTVQSTTTLYENPYVTDDTYKYFSLSLTLPTGTSSVVLQYFTTYPSASSTDLAAAASPTITQIFTVDTTSAQPLLPLAPTGFSISQRYKDVRVSWLSATEDTFIGNNFYLSVNSGGPYFKVNTSPITAKDTTSTVDRTYITIPISAIPKSYLGTTYSSAYTFYGVATTMLQTDTGQLLESPNSIELELKFYSFPSEYTSPINRHEADIQNALLSTIHSYESSLDIKPGSVLQDIFVNPAATELARAYQRLHFYHYASSLPTLLKYEDENGDGIPDTLSQSSLRQQLYQAFNLSSATEVQTWIDMAFERLATSQFDSRRGATTATGKVTFYTTVQPSQDITIPSGTVVTATTSTVSSSTVPKFVTIESGRISVQNLSSYYNSSKARWEIKLHVKSSTKGAAGNIGAGVLNSVSGITNLKVINEASLYGGQDAESNLDLAARLRDCYLAKDPGRKAGIKSWITQAAGIYSCNVVGAGDTYMMRDYDELRQLHVYGRADAYVNSKSVSEKSQTFVVTPSVRSTSTMTKLIIDPTLVSATTSDWVFTLTNSAIKADLIPFALEMVNSSLAADIQTYDIPSWTYTNLQDGSVTVHISPISGIPTPLATDNITAYLTIPVMLDGTTGTAAAVTSVSSTDWVITITDSVLTVDTPIYNVVYVRNSTRNLLYSLTGCSVSDAGTGTVKLHLVPSASAALAQDPTPALTDTIDLQITIFYTPGFLLETQPVLSVNTVTGEASSSGGAGSIDTSTVNLVASQDPMGLGNSTRDTAYLTINPTTVTHSEAVSFVTPDPLNSAAVVDMTYTASIAGVVPAWVYTPTITNNFAPTETYTEGVDYTLSINSNQELVITRITLDPSHGSYVVAYQTYNVFPRKFKVVGEPLVLNGTTATYLSHIGVDVSASSFKVTSDLAGEDVLVRYGDGDVPNYRLTPYDDNVQSAGTTSPYDDEYWAAKTAVIEGVVSASGSSIEKAVGIINMNLTEIPDGSTVYVSYEYYENLTVQYSVDQGVIDAQALVETNRSCTADILVKRCNYIPVRVQLSVALTSGANQTTVDTNIRTAVSTLFNNLSVGDGLYESEVIRAVKSISGVANITVPIDMLSFADGAMIMQERLSLWAATTELNTTTLSSSTTIYKSQTRSLYKSIDTGGKAWEYVAVYEDGLAMTRTNSLTEFMKTGCGDYGTFYVVQNATDYRLTIYINPNRTSSESADINSHSHSITYHVYGDDATHDLVCGDLSILTLDSLAITYS